MEVMPGYEASTAGVKDLSKMNLVS